MTAVVVSLVARKASAAAIHVSRRQTISALLFSTATANDHIATTKMIRLSKRMSELDLCSRREADAMIREGMVRVGGQVAVLGQKVATKETDIEILGRESSLDDRIGAVVLHKPRRYVSGQPEDGHLPAARLLTKENCTLSMIHNSLEFGAPSSLPYAQPTLQRFAPAGRLDWDSSGLLIFCRSGVLAKKLTSAHSKIEKEYIVTVEPAQAVSRRERQDFGLTHLPTTSNNLKYMKRGGLKLAQDARPLKPVVHAEWLATGEVLRLVLREGRKHQIRRMCRELLGYHVVDLQRIRIGPIRLFDDDKAALSLPEGQWRPLTKQEITEIMSF